MKIIDKYILYFRIIKPTFQAIFKKYPNNIQIYSEVLSTAGRIWNKYQDKKIARIMHIVGSFIFGFAQQNIFFVHQEAILYFSKALEIMRDMPSNSYGGQLFLTCLGSLGISLKKVGKSKYSE